MSFDMSAPMPLGEFAAHQEIEALAQVILETGMEQHEPGDCECRRSVARLVEIAHERTVDRERLDWLERTLLAGDTDTYGMYDQAAKCWFVGPSARRVESLRAAIDEGMQSSGCGEQ